MHLNHINQNTKKSFIKKIELFYILETIRLSMIILLIMTSRVLTGKEFNEKYANTRFVKLTNKEENHNGYQFKDGLNIDTIPFNTKKECSAGGIYFCEFNNFVEYLNYGYNHMHFMRNVVISDDAQVFEEPNGKYKSDKIILLDKSVIFENKEICLEAVRQNGCKLQYVKEQTPEICLVAVRQNGCALMFVKDKTPELCLDAIRQDGYALKYVKHQTPVICLEAVKQYGYALQYVKEQTLELCLEAVRQNGDALQFVKKQSPEICLVAVKQNEFALDYVKNQTPELCLIAVRRDGLALQYVKEQTPKICLVAVQQNGYALQYVTNQTPEICLAAVQQNRDVLQYIGEQPLKTWSSLSNIL